MTTDAYYIADAKLNLLMVQVNEIDELICELSDSELSMLEGKIDSTISILQMLKKRMSDYTA